MHRAVLVTPVLLVALSAAAQSQVIPRSMVEAYGSRSGGAFVRNNEPKHASMWTSTLPVTFSRLERANGDWRLGANMAVGGSYIYVTGKATPQVDGSYRLDPQFMFGPVANIGITPGDSGKLDGTLLVGLTMGFSSFAILGGYDLLLSRPVIGVGVQIQSLTFTDKLTHLVSLR